MSDPLVLAAGQINCWVGDLTGNVERMLQAASRARREFGADLIAFPELSLLGYPPDDLLMRSGLESAVSGALDQLLGAELGITLIAGIPEFDGNTIYNAAVVIRDGQIVARYRKQCLPNYGVFDERRHFTPGDAACVIDVGGRRVGVTICEDIWFPEPMAQARAAGAELIVNINASPFDVNKLAEREDVLTARQQETPLPIVYVNSVGGQDDVIFDGSSLALSGDGRVGARAPGFVEGVFPIRWDGDALTGVVSERAEPVAQIYDALVCATRDYVDRNRFPGVLVGLSGGIDSALVCAIAADALGPERVWAISMPSQYTAGMSRDDAREQCERLGVRFDEIAIGEINAAVLSALSPIYGDRAPDLSEENIQSRCRGLLLMGLSNKFGHLLLATGNKSELGVGYATLYGDMAGGFAPIKDVYKTTVYALANERNSRGEAIPQRVIDRPPSAELRPDQLDSDSLPDYPVLDGILNAYVEAQQSIVEVTALGYSEDDVRHVAGLVRRSEYKRRQAPPGPKITTRAFGRDRRYPITVEYGDL